MSGHSKWSPMDPENAFIDEMGLQYVAGYILALEDLLRDTSEFCPKTENEPVEGQTPYPAPCTRAYRLGQIHTMKEIRKRAGQSLYEARRTLKLVQEKMDRG